MTNNEKMITDEELIKRIYSVINDFEGQADDLCYAVGIVLVGRRYGWRVMRLISSRKAWMLACRLFGDLKTGDLMQEKGPIYSYSLGARIVDKLGHYWDFINGNKSREDLSNTDRKMLLPMD